MKPVSSAASIRQRLLNYAKEQGEAFDFVLVRYGVERFLYRLGVSRRRRRKKPEAEVISVQSGSVTTRIYEEAA